MAYRLVNKIFDRLSPRERDVLLRRYGIDGEEETLESIANDYDLSRERLRQIQNKAIEKILPFVQKNREIENLISSAKKYLKPIGVKREDSFSQLLKENLGLGDKDYKSFRFLAILHPQIIFHFKDTHFHNFYAQDEGTYTALRHSLKKIYFYFLEKNTIHPQEKILNIARREIKRHIKKDVSIDDLIDFLLILKHLLKNPFDFWGFYNHPHISGKSLRDKIYLILKFTQKPLHFREIEKKLKYFSQLDDKTIHFNWRKNYSLDSIKNELIRHDEFILVGRGTYALKEWNIIGGTAKDLILKILKEEKKIEREKLWQKISQYRQIKKSSFLIYLKQLKIKRENNWLIYND